MPHLPVQSADRPRSIFRILIGLGLIFLLLIALAELSLRLLLGLGHPIVVAPDVACSYIEAPNQHTWRFFHEVRINRYGMRSAEFAAQPAPGSLRVLFVGDSVTYGTSRVGQSEIFTQILRRELPSAVHQPVEVLNASASGWAIDNELSYVRSRGIFHSSLVLLVLNDGDVTQPRALITTGVSQDTTLNHPTTALGEIWTRYLSLKLRHLAAPRDAGDIANTNDAAESRNNLIELDQFRQLVNAAHARFALVYLPFRADIPQPAAQAQVLLRQWAAAQQVPFLDLTAAEQAESTAAITLDGDHLNTRGNELVARGIEEQWPAVLGAR